jgi:hypothetical protein
MACEGDVTDKILDGMMQRRCTDKPSGTSLRLFPVGTASLCGRSSTDRKERQGREGKERKERERKDQQMLGERGREGERERESFTHSSRGVARGHGGREVKAHGLSLHLQLGDVLDLHNHSLHGRKV